MECVTKIASHRGGAQVWPENSREAFRNSMGLPVDLIEFDLHRSRDGVLVVHHDPLLGRTSEGQGAIADLDWAELSRVALKRTAGETVPSFDEVLDILTTGPMGLRIELKTKADGARYAGIEAEIVAVLERRRLLPLVTFTSFDLDTLSELASISPGTPLIYLVKSERYEPSPRGLAHYCDLARQAGVRELAIRVEQFRDGDVAFCAERDVRLGVFAAHDETSIAKAFTQRVAAFTTDRPDLAIAVRDRLTKTLAS